MEQRYALVMDDYATVSFVSASKFYYGTIAEIGDFITRLPDDFNESKAAFRAFLDGDTEATHTVAYNKKKLLEPVQTIYERKQSLGPQQWGHTNVWGCIYPMRCDEVQISQIVLLHQGKYYRCIRACFQNLHYKSVAKLWRPIGDMLWGLPEFLQVTQMSDGNFTVESMLHVQEASFKTKEEALQSLTDMPPKYDKIIEEIFGDG